jgi:hypothetical protein
MAYSDDYNLYASQNPSEAVPQSQGQQPGSMADPLVAEAKFAPPAPTPAPYSGLQGDPFQTAVVASAQIQAHRKPKRQLVQAPVAPMFSQYAGLSALLGR